MATHWGDVPTWVAAIGSSGAMIVAFLGWNSERSARRRGEERERRSQARLVSVEAQRADASHADPETWTVLEAVTISNRSDEPVTDLNVKIELRAGTDWRGAPVEPRSVAIYVPIVGARQHHVVQGSFRVPSAAHAPIPVEQAASVYFTDFAGRRWLRTSSGELEETA